MSDNTIQLSFEKRTITGKKVKQLRQNGQIPVVIHDHGKTSVLAQVVGKDLLKVIAEAGKHHPIILKSDNKKDITVMIKEAVFEPKKQTITHVVFNSIFSNQKVEAEIPLKPQYLPGNDASPAERAGLIVIEHLESVVVEALPDKLPDVIYYDAEKLVTPSDHISVLDLIVPKDVVIITDSNQSVVSVYEPSAVEAANNALAGDEEEKQETTEAEATEATTDTIENKET